MDNIPRKQKRTRLTNGEKMTEPAIDIHGVFTVDRTQEHRDKFFEKVRELPHRGQGLNDALVGTCNTGINAGLTPDEVAAAVMMERGNELKPGELERAIAKATDGKGYVSAPVRKPRTEAEKRRDAIAADEQKRTNLNRQIIEAGGGKIEMDAAELWESSFPRPVGGRNTAKMEGGEALPDVLAFLKTFYQDGEYLYFGKGMEKQAEQAEHVKTAAAWYQFFKGAIATNDPNKIKRLGEDYPYMIPNPLTGRRDAKGSYRSDECIAVFRFVLVESDTLPLNEQIPLFRGLHLPVFTLTYTGGKSIHALVSVERLTGKKILTLEQWRTEVKEKFFRGRFLNIELDHATNNPGRLSRTPGMFRADKGRFQRTIYNNAAGVDLWQTTNKYL